MSSRSERENTFRSGWAPNTLAFVLGFATHLIVTSLSGESNPADASLMFPVVTVVAAALIGGFKVGSANKRQATLSLGFAIAGGQFIAAAILVSESDAFLLVGAVAAVGQGLACWLVAWSAASILDRILKRVGR